MHPDLDQYLVQNSNQSVTRSLEVRTMAEDEFDLQKWCGGPLVRHTPVTVAIPVSRAAAEAISRAYDDIRHKTRAAEWVSEGKDGGKLWRRWLFGGDAGDSSDSEGEGEEEGKDQSRLSEGDRRALRALAGAIEAAIATVSGSGGGRHQAFVRLR
jgi:hypothetical protein